MKHVGVITGGTGYIGSHLLRYLLQNNWEIHIIVQREFSRSNVEDIKEQVYFFKYINNIDVLIEYFQKIKAEVVFHLAAAVITNYKPEQISTLIQSNIQFGTEILEAMKHSSTRLFIGTGTYWQNYHSEVYSPVDLYAATKEAFEKVLQYYVDAHGFRAITLRLFDVYGEDDKRPKLLNRLREIAGTDEKVEVSPGEQYLDMIHISDVCSAYLKAFELLEENKEIRNNIYGVYTGNCMKLKEIILLFQSKLDKHISVIFGGKEYKNREVMYPMRGYSKLPNWSVNVDIDSGLEMYNNAKM